MKHQEANWNLSVDGGAYQRMRVTVDDGANSQLSESLGLPISVSIGLPFELVIFSEKNHPDFFLGNLNVATRTLKVRR